MKQITKLEKILKGTFKDSFLFTKYPELTNGKDTSEKGSFPFIEGGYDDQTIIAETMRFYSVAAIAGAGFLMPKQAPKEQIDNLLNEFGIVPGKIVEYDNSNPESYLSIIGAMSESSLHVLHPYGAIPSEKYAVQPSLLFWLNKKDNLPKITKHTPQINSPKIDELVNQSFPFVIKKSTGSSGDGVKIIKSKKDLEGIASFLNGDKDFFVQDYVPAVNNYGIQFLINELGFIHFVGFGSQNTTASGEFQGICCELDGNPPAGLMDVACEAVDNIASKGYYGFLGLDVLQDSNGKYSIIDPNIRCTAATPVYLLKDQLKMKLGNKVYIGSSKIKANTPSEVISGVKGAGGILLSMSDKSPEGIYKFFAMFGGKTNQEALSKWTAFAS